MKDSRSGEVQVRGGKVIVTDPFGDGERAVIFPGKGVKLFVDDSLVEESALVTEDSKIRVEVENKESEKKFDIDIDGNKLSAKVRIFYSDGKKYKLKDKPPKNQMALEVFDDEIIKCEPYTIEEAKSILKSRGIVYGILEEELIKAISEGTGKSVVVAKGQEPVDGTNDALVPKFKNNDHLVEVNGRVDFYSIGKIASVEEGELVAEKVPGDEGKPGINILGAKTNQRRGRKYNLTAGKGTTISEDGLKIYAKTQGRPDIKGWVVNVNEVYEIKNDVDVSTGNIEFVGDVVIKGNIKEGMKVRAGNDVILLGNITGGEIIAGGNVTVKNNIIGSTIKAGYNDFMNTNIIESLEKITKMLDEIFFAAEMLKNTGKLTNIYRDGQIIKLLIDTKYPAINKYISELQEILLSNREIIDMDTMQLGAKLIKYYTGKGPLLISNYDTLKEHSEYIKNQIEVLNSSIKEPSNIMVNYAQNSYLSTSGNIKVNGKGCYTSVLTCKGDVIFEGKIGVLRGGSIDAVGDVYVNELGSPGGAMTTVGVGKDSTITAEIAHLNRVLRVGSLSTKLEGSVRNLKAYLYKGELMTEKSNFY